VMAGLRVNPRPDRPTREFPSLVTAARPGSNWTEDALDIFDLALGAIVIGFVLSTCVLVLIFCA
jgi:hypothetical protein